MQDASLIFSRRVGENFRVPYIIVRDAKSLTYDSPDACSSVPENGNDTKTPALYNVHLLRHLVETVWKIERPQVIISVTGGAQTFDLSSKFKDIIMKGMMDGTRNLKALFITGGTNAGIMRYVGEARAKYNPTVPLIGIVALGPVKGASVLLDQWDKKHQKRGQLYDTVKEGDKKDRGVKNERMKRSEKKWGPGVSELDNHHSHFILVHDEDSKDFGDENPVRSAFEKCMSAPKQEIRLEDGAHKISAGGDAEILSSTLDEDNVPIVTVCVQGGPGSITTVAGSVINSCNFCSVQSSRASYVSVSEYSHCVFPFSITSLKDGLHGCR